MNSIENNFFFKHPQHKRAILDIEFKLIEAKALDPLSSTTKIYQELIENNAYIIYDEPKKNAEKITLGSRAKIQSPNESYTVDIVGIKELGTDLETGYCEPSSPIAQIILGKKIGEVVTLRTTLLTIVDIDQEVIGNNLQKQLDEYL